MNTVKAALLLFLRVFFKTRDSVLVTGDFVHTKFSQLWVLILSICAAIMVAVFVAFACVFFGASKLVGIGAGACVLVYYFFNSFRQKPPPQDYLRRGRRVESKKAPNEYP